MGGLAGLAYAGVFAALVLLHVPAISVAAYFAIPTALVAIAGGPAAGGAAAVLSMTLVYLGGYANGNSGDAVALSFSSGARFVALLCTGIIVGWFAARNRALVAELRCGAENDNLTGLGNHRYYESALDRRLQSGQTFGLLLCDMDGLKDVNDGQGHSAGDAALRTLADHLRAVARADDEIARIGGDEFCLVVNVPSEEDAVALATRLEAALAGVDCPATFGWAVYPVDARSKTDLFKIADQRLYARKASRETALRSLPAAS